MLEIKNITKVYETDGFKQKALDDVSLNFRECEFASILGPSGSGKTTFLNIIGGLDHYTSGDLVINGTSTKEYKDADWDSYRNHRIGFVFQSYNLISHQTILSNVMLALTLSGISKKESMERAKKALTDVGLRNHIHKRPNQLSGGQMQRVAIARALVNDPDILLADEPTGALDSNTSVQIMELLKEIAKKKLVIMVTHNPDLANEYSSRIITLKDGKITSDTNPFDGKDEKHLEKEKTKKTKMSFLTALSLSFNNLMTKKGRTILVAIAGSIGIIGIALIEALSNGFQNYVDKIGEDTLTSYPLNIMQESRDITGTLLSLTSPSKKEEIKDGVKEEQYISSMLKSVSTNDLKSFKKHLEDNYNQVEKDISTVKYAYSVEPNIYTIDATKKLAKINPSNLFSSMFNSNMMSSYSSFSSVYSQMIDNYDLLNQSYDILKGHWPENYNEMVIVLSERNTISDLLVYSLGLRDTEKLSKMINQIMKGESNISVDEPLTLSYDDLLNIDLRLIMASDTYKYNSKYNLYEDMSENSEHMMNLYNNAIKLKIVGIVTAKEGVTTMALSPGVCYTKELTDYIINYAASKDVVKRQQEKTEIDVFSGSRFDEKNNLNIDFKDLVTVDNNKLASAFNVKIDQKSLENETAKYMSDIGKAITTNIDPAKDVFQDNLNKLSNGLFQSITDEISLNDVDSVISDYLNTDEVDKILTNMQKEYIIPKDNLKMVYSGLLKGLLQTYITSYVAVDSSKTTDPTNPVAIINNELVEEIKSSYNNSAIVIGTINTMGKGMTEAKMQSDILSKVGELTGSLSKTFANAFKVDANKISDSFKLKMTEEEITRIITAMMNNNETNAKTNLITLGYQDKDSPTYISFYFNSFDGKEDFLSFIDKYNDSVEESKKLNYSDTTGILMSSVKTIVDAVSYVLIGFVSISLVVSSFMIGIITYISVFERTKEIGILRSIGASKRNISSIFNAETFIIGLLSGLFGIGISYTLIPIINMVIHHFTGNIPLSASLRVNYALFLVILSIILTLIGGIIPSRSASRKDPVEALRSE